MKIEYICQSGKGLNYLNEDAVGFDCKKFFFVIDGATPLVSGHPYMDRYSDATWFARETANCLQANLHDTRRELSFILQDCMSYIKSQWAGPQEPSAMPSAGIAIIRFNEDKMEYLGLGDCSVCIQQKSSFMNIYTEKRLAYLDSLAIHELLKLSQEKNMTPAACLPLIQSTLVKHRQLANQKGGYSILDPSGTGIQNARKATLPSRDISSFLLCTDGFEQLKNFLGISLEKLFVKAKHDGLSSTTNLLFQLQEHDADFQKVPRFKMHDDSSAVFVDMEEV